MPMLGPKLVPAVFETIEVGSDRRMIDRLVALVRDEVLLADVGDVALLGVLGEQMVEGLVLRRADRFGDRLVPFSLLAKTGSTSKTTPRKSNSLWRTTSPMPKRALAIEKGNAVSTCE